MLRTRRWLAAAAALMMLAAVVGTSESEAATGNDVAIAIDVVSAPLYGYYAWGSPLASGSFTLARNLSDTGAASGVVGYTYAGATFSGILTGVDGTLVVQVSGATWTVTDGSGAYAGASGHGTASLTLTPVYATWNGWTFLVGIRWQWTLTGSVDT